MGRTEGFEPEWTERHTQIAQQFAKQHTGKEPGLDSDEYVKWLYGVKR
ncbi:MAG: hypothetical protein OXP12_04765 [Thaumarchaeota archaeon]|nr:hypothetical protein [Nitrososphaerota archaeon]MDE0525190.1 hypothetical protein [Nitrososphaerota archaeon]